MSIVVPSYSVYWIPDQGWQELAGAGQGPTGHREEISGG